MSSDVPNKDCYDCTLEFCHPHDRPCVLCTRNVLNRRDYFRWKKLKYEPTGKITT